MWPNEHQNIMVNLPRIHKVHGYCFNPFFLMLQHQHRLREYRRADKGFVYTKYHHYINLWAIFFRLHEFLILRKEGNKSRSWKELEANIFNEIFRMEKFVLAYDRVQILLNYLFGWDYERGKERRVSKHIGSHKRVKFINKVFFFSGRRVFLTSWPPVIRCWYWFCMLTAMILRLKGST